MTTPVLDVVDPRPQRAAHGRQPASGGCTPTWCRPSRTRSGSRWPTTPAPTRPCAVASGLVAELPAVALVRLTEKGRGRALKQVWLASDAPILAYMDVDLSTDLDALVAAGGAADVRTLRRRHRVAAGARGPGGPRSQSAR